MLACSLQLIYKYSPCSSAVGKFFDAFPERLVQNFIRATLQTNHQFLGDDVANHISWKP